MFESTRIQHTTEVLGRGGFSYVYRGFCDGEEAAIKRVLIEEVDTKEEVFMRNFQHRNLLQLLHVEITNIFK